jgi:hypothetical protein
MKPLTNTDPTPPSAAVHRARRRRTWLRRATIVVLVIFVLAGVAAGGYAWLQYHGPTVPVEIYRGVVYSCIRLPDANESGGLLHLVRADLTVPGVDLYTTPPNDPDAVAHGRQCKLDYVSSVVKHEHLAAAVNGTLFDSDSGLIRRTGDFASCVETVVADHVVSHVGKNTYLLWWDDDRVAHMEHTKPPSAAVLAKARWGIGAQQSILNDGQFSLFAGHTPDRRTAIAVDPERKLVWIAVFDRASYYFAAQTLAEQGAKTAILVDGGTSSAMALGPDTAGGVRPGTVTGNWRPVASVFGFRAERE